MSIILCKKLLDCPCNVCCVLFIERSVCQMKTDILVARFMYSASFNIFPIYLLPSKVVIMNCYHTSIKYYNNARPYLKLHMIYIMLAITLQLTCQKLIMITDNLSLMMFVLLLSYHSRVTCGQFCKYV